MFSLFSLIAPGIFKNMIPNLLKYLKVILIVSVFIVIGVFTYRAYSSITDTLKEIEDNKILIVQQQETIKQQAQDLKTITEQLQQMKESHQATLEILHQLSLEKQKVTTITKKRKDKLDKDISDINNLPTDNAAKRELRSAALVENLNGTYCELFPTKCTTEAEVKSNE